MSALVSPIPGAPYSDGYGPRAPITTAGGTSGGFHYGQDYAAGANTPILAAASGEVIAAGWIGTYGNAVYIDHGSGIVTRYAHMIGHPPVVHGQHVAQGERIGFVGSTGASTGPHLHFEVVVHGTRVDPLDYLIPAPPSTAKETAMKYAMRYTKNSIDHVIVGETTSGWAFEYTTRDSAFNNKMMARFKFEEIINVDESIYNAFKASLAAVRQGK